MRQFLCVQIHKLLMYVLIVLSDPVPYQPLFSLLLFTLLFVSAICQMQDRVSGGESSSRRVGKALSRTPTEEGSILQLIFINRRERRGNSTFSNQSLGIPPPFRHAGGGTTRQLLRLLLLERTSASSRVALPLRPSLVLLLIPAGQRNQSGAALD